MKKDQPKNTTINWIISVANKYNFEIETVEGIYKEIIGKYPAHAKAKTLEFIHLYSEGRKENGSDTEL